MGVQGCKVEAGVPHRAEAGGSRGLEALEEGPLFEEEGEVRC